jgi:hypothetical protein
MKLHDVMTRLNVNSRPRRKEPPRDWAVDHAKQQADTERANLDASVVVLREMGFSHRAIFDIVLKRDGGARWRALDATAAGGHIRALRRDMGDYVRTRDRYYTIQQLGAMDSPCQSTLMSMAGVAPAVRLDLINSAVMRSALAKYTDVVVYNNEVPDEHTVNMFIGNLEVVRSLVRADINAGEPTPHSMASRKRDDINQRTGDLMLGPDRVPGWRWCSDSKSQDITLHPVRRWCTRVLGSIPICAHTKSGKSTFIADLLDKPGVEVREGETRRVLATKHKLEDRVNRAYAEMFVHIGKGFVAGVGANEKQAIAATEELKGIMLDMLL